MFTDDKVIQVTRELPEEFPYNRDVNSGNPLGVGAYLLLILKPWYIS